MLVMLLLAVSIACSNMTLYFPIPITGPFAKLFQKQSKKVPESCSMSQINDFLPYTSLHVVGSQKLISLIQSTFMKCKKIPFVRVE